MIILISSQNQGSAGRDRPRTCRPGGRERHGQGIRRTSEDEDVEDLLRPAQNGKFREKNLWTSIGPVGPGLVHDVKNKSFWPQFIQVQFFPQNF